METDQIKAETDVKPGTLRDGHRSIALTENEGLSAAADIVDGVPVRLAIATKRPNFFLPLGSRFRFRNKWANYGWRVRAWTPRADGRAEIVFGFPELIYGKKRAKPATPSPMYR